MAENKLGVGVIGLGVGEQLADAFECHPDCRVVALCDVDQTRLESVAKRLPQARQYRAAEALIDDSNVQIVVVASYDHHHARQILRALDSDRHVFTEKPMCTSFTDAAAIRAALLRNPHLRISSNTILRMSPRFRALKENILARKMGDIYYAEGDYNYGRLQKLTEGWRGRVRGYSVMLGGGIHMVDLLLWLIGVPVVEVSAFGNAIASKNVGSNFAGQDLTVGLLRFTDGTIAKVAANFGCMFPHFHRVIIYGTEATFENALPHALRYTTRDPMVSPTAIKDAYPGMDKGDLVPSFIDAVKGRGRAVVDEQDIFAALAVSFAIDLSLASGHAEQVQRI